MTTFASVWHHEIRHLYISPSATPAVSKPGRFSNGKVTGLDPQLPLDPMPLGFVERKQKQRWFSGKSQYWRGNSLWSTDS